MLSVRYRKLGRTAHEVSEIGCGTWGIGKQMWAGSQDFQSFRALHRAADQGVNFIDTALAYGNGHSERLVGSFLRERKERIYVATKIPPRNLKWPAQGTLQEVFPVDHILNCIQASLQNLKVERIDLLQLHVWNPSWLNQDEWYAVFSRLKEEGKIAYFGVSVNDHRPNSVLELVDRGKIDMVQVIYNIFDQSPEEKLFPLCLKKGVGVIARVPLDEGALTGSITPKTCFPRRDWRNFYFRGDRKRKVFERVEKLRSLLDGEAATLPSLALKFCLHHKAVSTVIPGMRSVDHVDVNVAVSDQPPLSIQMVQQLRAHRWERNFYL